MTTPEIFALTLAVSIGLILAYPLGYCAGKSRGIALGWQDGYFKRTADDRAKRGKDGQFISRKKEGNK